MGGSKAELRRRLLSRRGSAAPDSRPAGESISARLRALPELSAARTVCAYAATRGEPDPAPFVLWCLGAGLRVALPVFRPEFSAYALAEVRDPATDVAIGRFGIPEPLAGLPELSDEERCAEDVFWVVPGVGFTAAGDRLGRGAGYYDRLLAGVRGVLVGICHDWQVVESIPHETHDVRMSRIVTEKRVYKCSSAPSAGRVRGQKGRQWE